MLRIAVITATIVLASTASTQSIAKNSKNPDHLRCGYSLLKFGMTEREIIKKCSPVKLTNRRTSLNRQYVWLTLHESGKFIKYITLRNNRVVKFTLTNKRQEDAYGY